MAAESMAAEGVLRKNGLTAFLQFDFRLQKCGALGGRGPRADAKGERLVF